MELELKKACLDTYTSGGEITLTQEETAETIVPDSCPDIARIIETEGKIFLHSRELRDGKAEISGTLRVTVLYIAEKEDKIRALEFAMPFAAESENRSLPGCSFLMADTELEFLESRTLNPRKVFTHAKLVIRLIGYRKVPLCIPSDIISDETQGVEKRIECQRAILLTQIGEKDFTFTDDFSLSPGKDGAVELLNCRVTDAITEVKVVGSKLIFKGLFYLSLLYRMADGRSTSAAAELPFSQIMEMEGAVEGASVSIRIQLTGIDVQIDGDDPEGRQIAVTVYFHATALLRNEQELMLLDDLYSTVYDVSYEAMPLEVTDFYESASRRQTVREVLEVGAAAEKILSISVTCGAVSVSREENVAVLRTGALVRVLYLDESGAPLAAERSIDVNCQMNFPEGCHITAYAVCNEEVQGSLGDRGIEIRFPLDFQVEAVSRISRICISSAKLETDSPKDLTGSPSLVLRRLAGQETAWDLAKRYHTTIRAILSANELGEEDQIPQDKLLLIPRKRM